MTGDEIPDPHHVVRFVSPSLVVKDENQVPTGGIAPQAFKLKPKDEGKLSVVWLEYFAGDGQAQRVAAVKSLRNSMDVRPRSGFAVGQVGAIKARCLPHAIRIVHAPVDINLAHAEVINLPENDDTLLEALATGEWSELLLNTNVPEGKEPAPAECAYKAA